MRSYRITRVYVVRGADKEDARRELTLSLAIPSRDADEYLDFESIREIVPESKSWRQEVRDQLFGSSSPVKPAVNGSRSWGPLIREPSFERAVLPPLSLCGCGVVA